jgi:histidinol-phosphate aminotransferase
LEPDFTSELHGGINPHELKSLGIISDQLIDFSVNSNPFGPSPRVLQALQRVDIAQYPDRACSELTELLAFHNRVPSQRILVGNGTTELIRLIVQVMLKPGDKELVVGPTFAEYRMAAEMVGAEVIEVRAEPPDFTPDINAISSAIQKNKPRLVFLCNPNNPTGQVIPDEEMARLIQACQEPAILVIDQAYRAFAGSGFFADPPEKNVIILRSMTKDFAMAGLRLGYLIADQPLIKRLLGFQPTWSVNAYAQAGGCAALNDLPYYLDSLEKLQKLKENFFIQLSEVTGRSVTSRTHYGLLHTVQPARELRRILLKNRIQVRDGASFGLPFYIRISTRLQADNQVLLQVLRSPDVHSFF